MKRAKKAQAKRSNDALVGLRIPEALRAHWEDKATRQGLGLSTWMRRELMQIHPLEKRSRAA